MTVPILAYLTMKEGVGKTTLAANLTRGIAEARRRRILLIDADSQCNLTQLFLDSDQIDKRRSIYDVLDQNKLHQPADIGFQIPHS
jgi:cellulose biosynthesis protein BcsQ